MPTFVIASASEAIHSREVKLDCSASLALLGRSCWIEESGGLRCWLELDVKAELFKTSNEPAGLEFEGAPIKVGGAEVMVLGTVFEDVVDGGEDRCRDSADGFLRPTLALQPEELGSVVAVFLALGGPGALHQHGLEPGGSLAQARRFALAGAFVLPRTQPGPGDEVPSGWKAVHVAADLGHDGGGRQGADSGDCAQKLDHGTKGDLTVATLRMQAADPLIDFAVDLSDRPIQAIPLLQVQVEEKAVVIRQPPMQRVVELLRRRLDLLAGQLGQLTRLANTFDHRLDHPSAARAHDIADDRVELDLGFNQRNSWISSPGTKLALISPHANRSAIHVASFTSVLRPGTFLMCAAFATINSKGPSPRILNTGIQ